MHAHAGQVGTLRALLKVNGNNHWKNGLKTLQCKRKCVLIVGLGGMDSDGLHEWKINEHIIQGPVVNGDMIRTGSKDIGEDHDVERLKQEAIGQRHTFINKVGGVLFGFA